MSEDETSQIKDRKKRKNFKRRNIPSVTNLSASEKIQKKPKLLSHNSLKENELERAFTSRNQRKF